MRSLTILLPLALLPACATLTDGRRQIVTLTTDPPGAACVVDQIGAAPGDHLDTVAHTPGTVLIDRSNKALKVTCALQGFPTTQAVQGSGIDPYIAGNVLNGMIIGTAIDFSSGAAYRYPNIVSLRLAPTPPPPPPPPAAATPVKTAPRGAVKPTPLDAPPLSTPPAATAPAKPAPAHAPAADTHT